MDLLKLKIGRRKDLCLLGYYKDDKIWQVLKKSLFKKSFWKSYFIAERKNGKKQRIFANAKKEELTKAFASTITFIALKLAKNVDVINYVGCFYNYHIWEAWLEDSSESFSSAYIFYNYSNYIVLTDKNQIEEIKAYLLVRKSYKI